MIYRFMYTAFCDGAPNVTDLREPSVTHLCVTAYENQIFLYIESTSESIDPSKVIAARLKPYPDGSYFFRMTEVFHYSKPFSEEHWKRKDPTKKPWVRINYLVPEKTASYFFYHYQFQEENPGMVDKYGILFLYGNMLVLYHETPFEEETLSYKGSLDTHNTPVGKEAWDDMIERHFIPWEDDSINNDPDGPWLALSVLIYK